jgi:hypothetical protein
MNNNLSCVVIFDVEVIIDTSCKIFSCLQRIARLHQKTISLVKC